MKGKIGLQLYSIRKEMNADNFEEVLKKVKSIGYDGVEFFDFYDKPASEIKVAVENADLEPVSSHVGYDEIVEDPEGVMDYHEKIGCKNLVVPWFSEEHFETEEAVKETAEKLSKLAEKVSDRGFQLGYHNHDQEIVEIGDTTAFEMFDNLIGDKLLIQPDVGNAEKAGIDAAEYFTGFKSGFISLHVKDSKREEAVDTPLGEGDVDLKKFVKMGLERDVEWYIIENEGSDDPMEAVKKDFEFLNSLKV